MCASSYVGDYARDTIPNRFPWVPSTHPMTWPTPSEVSRAEFDALKREVEELKTLLAAANKYDEATGQRECAQAEKIEFLRKIAEFVGVDLSAVLK